MREPRTSLDDVVAVAQRLATVLDGAGHHRQAGELRAAVDMRAAPPERLLELRSALIATRNEWERCADARLRKEAAATLSRAKRLAIEI